MTKKFTWREITLLVLGSPIWLSLLIAAAAVIISLYAALWAVIISLWAVFASFAGCAFAFTICGIYIAFGEYTLSGIAMIGAGLVCAGLSVFLCYACKAATKGTVILAKMLMSGVKKCFRPGRAHDAYKKLWLTVASALIIIGSIIFVGVMTMLNWDFSKLSTVKYETNSYKFDENYKNVSIETTTADIVLIPSDTTTTSVICYEQERIKHSVRIKDNTLVIQADYTGKWYEHLGISCEMPRITVYIPQSEYDTVSIKDTTGNITASSVKCNDIEIGVTTGDVSLTNVLADEKISIKVTTGNVNLDRSDAGEIFIKTTTGYVNGTLLSEKVFIAKATTGSINVPDTATGGKCQITTTTGNVNVQIAQ